MPRTGDAAGRPDLFGERQPAERIRADSGAHYAVTALASVASRLLRLAALVVLARLLTPADYGVVALVMSVFGIATLLRDLGLSAATVQRPQITRAQVSTLFWISVGLGTVMTSAGMLAAPLLVDLFADERLADAGRVLALAFLVNSLAAQPLALLRRNLRFTAIARNDLQTVLATCLTAIVLAWLGAGFWALVLAQLAGDVAAAAGAWLRSGWRPDPPRYDPTVRDMLGFGGYLVGFGVMNYLGRNLHLVFIGRLWGAAGAGLYTRAVNLVDQPLTMLQGPLQLIGPAALARLRESPREYASYYLDTIGALMLVAAPLSLALALLGPDVVHVLLGSQWQDAGTLLRWLAIGIAPQVLNHSSGWLYVSTGRTRQMMNWGIGGWAVVIACLLFGLQWHLPGVAAMHSVAMFLILAPCLAFACRDTPVRPAAIAQASWRPYVAAVLAAIPVALAVPRLGEWPALARIAVLGPAYAALYVGIATLALGQGGRFAALWLKARESVGKVLRPGAVRA